MHASSLILSPDGNRLFLYSWRDGDPGVSTDVLDLKTSTFGPPYAGEQLSAARRMGGSLVMVSAMTVSNSREATRMTVHDYIPGELTSEWTSPTYASWLTSP
jgi:hypothetical protein